MTDLIFHNQFRLSSTDYIVEIHKSLWRDWMEDYSTRDFLSGGKICEEPEKYGDPKWASNISNLHYQVYPTTIKGLSGHFVQGYVYLVNDENGKIKIGHYEPIKDITDANKNYEEI